jgi:hypothetical protein
MSPLFRIARSLSIKWLTGDEVVICTNAITNIKGKTVPLHAMEAFGGEEV